jgi:ATP-binding cassette subfamily E protein 1
LINSPADYFTKLLEDDLKAVVKPQYVDQIPRAVRTADKSVKALIEGRHTLGNLDEVLDTLGRLPPFSAHARFSSADTRQSFVMSMTVTLTIFPVVSFSVSPLVPSACRRPMCKPLSQPIHHAWLTVDRYMFDEPSSYLDVKQRLSAARIIRSLLRPDD